MRRVIAIELMTAAQAIDLRPEGPARLGRGTAIAYHAIRACVPYLAHDRETAPDIERLAALIRTSNMVAQVYGTGA